MDHVSGWFSVVLFDALVAVCALLVPGPVVKGYVCYYRFPSQRLKYVLNGVRIWLIFMLAVPLSVYLGIVRGDFIVTHFWSCVLAGNVLGLVYSLYFYIRGKRLPPHHRETARVAPTISAISYSPKRSAKLTATFKPQQQQQQEHEQQQQQEDTPADSSNFLVDFFVGFEFNPRLGQDTRSPFASLFDYKMYLYLVGALSLQAVVLSAAYSQWLRDGELSLEMKVYTGLFSFFILEYLYHEHVHLYTYDLFAEKLGFKLIWGCLCFYPYFYPCGVWSVLENTGSSNPHPMSAWGAFLCIVMFFVGWATSRGANNQKYYFKIAPNKPFLGIQPHTVRGRILCTGWWRLSRHINYLGEILMATALALPGGRVSWVPWLYPLYYVALLFPREREDSRVCALKYGDEWLEYCKRVPYRIVPYFY
eukprot:TRINITY_DN8654_c0_g1_i1.p1 TRINITY_DN8654_c0_g1~~TRINITY_DN8654_c0_g1_i1.p1  ORF type:complete len:420 (-),score=58.73 TRINITY_DN8654_c0_g1_i1:13-1272(-)